MNLNRLAIGLLAMGLVMTITLGSATAFEIPYRGTISGSFISTEIDAVHPGAGSSHVAVCPLADPQGWECDPEGSNVSLYGSAKPPK